MEQLPLYVYIVFIITTLLTVWFLYKASNYSRPIVITIILWLMLQSVICLSGFYTITKGIPPRFALLLLPPIVFIAVLFFVGKGKNVIDSFSSKTLTLLHVVRIPVELTLYWLFLQKTIPAIMTFEGRNFDIFCGLTAPVVYYFGYIKNVVSKNLLLSWNLICLLMLANIVVTAVLSAPFSFQKFGFNQPNIALFYFPFVWLPCCIVPAALFAHLVVIRNLTKTISNKKTE